MNKKALYITAIALMSYNLTFAQELHQQLDEVTVIASRTTKKTEGYMTNLRGADIVKGKRATEILPFLPNISCEHGVFKINGLTASEIYVDGDLLSDLSELKNIPGEMIDKIEVKYLAGANQNASLSGGVIKLTLRRPPKGGYYGSVSANADWERSCGFGNEGIGALMYYQYNNLSVYDNLQLNHSKSKEESEQWQTGPDLLTFLSETSKLHGVSFRNRLSLTQQFASHAQLGGSYLISTSRPRFNSVTQAENDFSTIGHRTNIMTHEGTLKFTLPLNRKGSTMELVADYFNRNSDKSSMYGLNEECIGKVNDDNNLNLWKFKADFVYPQSRKLVWKWGASIQQISSSYTPTVITESDRFNSSSIPTNTGGFTPIIYAAAQGKVWKMRYSVGANWQLNRISYENRSANTKDHDTQWGINPTIQVMMPLGANMKHAFMLNYKRTMNEIPYSAISSVINWSDAYNYTIGNSDLKAESADMIMAGLSLYQNKLNISAVYARSHNAIYWQTFQDENNAEVYYAKPINLSGQDMWGVGAEWIENPVKWWRFKLSGRLEIIPENMKIDGVEYDQVRLKSYFYFNNSFKFSSSFGGMLNANVEPYYRKYDRAYHTVFQVEGRIYKSFMKNRLQCALDFTALGNRRKLTRQIGENKVTYKYTSPVQLIGATLTWHFSGGKKMRKVEAIDGIQDYKEIKDFR